MNISARLSAFAITILLLVPALSYAYSDRDNSDIYTKQSQYSPGWVMDSVYNPKAEAGMKDSVDKLNAAENTQAIKQKNADNPDATAESKLPLKKKRSGGEGKEGKITKTTPEDDTSNVVGGINIPVDDSKDGELKFLNPAKARTMLQDEIDNSPLANGRTLTIDIPNSSNRMVLRQENNQVTYEVVNGNGDTVRVFSNLYADKDSNDIPSDDFYGNYLLRIVYNTAGSPSFVMGHIGYNLTDYYYNANANPIFNKTYFAALAEVYAHGAFSSDWGYDASYRIQEMNSSTYYIYGVYGGAYTFTNSSYQYGVEDNLHLFNNPPANNSGSHLAPPTLYTSPPAIITTTPSFTPSPYRPYSKYDYTSLDDSYNQYKTNNNNDSSLPSSLNKAKEDKTLTDKTLNSINPATNPSSINPSDYRINNPYLIDSSFTDPLSLKTKTTELEDMILVLDQKESKTKIEEDILTLAKVVEENMAYLDQETIKEFTEAVSIIKTLDEMKTMLTDLDFANIDKSLTKLVEDQRGLYNDYLTKTESVYQKLEAILGIDIDNDLLPDAYIPLAKANALAKKKIAIDLALERLKAKESNTLSDNEKLALNINQELLSPIRNEYINKLKMSVTSFVWDIRDMTKGKEPVSILKDDTNLNIMFMLKDDIVQQ